MTKTKEKGQVIIILLLTVVVALAIGLSISTRSINEISTATKTEQSTRAYSAAEAGVERALQNIQSNVTGTQTISNLTNQADSTFTTSGLLPSSINQALEYGVEGIGKDEVAQVWLADPNNNMARFYDQDNFDLYFGNPSQPSDDDKPAVEVIAVILGSSGYQATRSYYDAYSGSGNRRNNGFVHPAAGSNFACGSYTIDSIISTASRFYCWAHVTGVKSVASDKLVMLRIRIIYSSAKQKLAVMPTNSSALPPQARLITSVGTAGSVQRRIQVFKQDFVVPPFFDYVLFSASDIIK